MKVALIFVRDGRFYHRPSEKFTARRKRSPYPGNKSHYVFGQPPLGIMYLSSVLKAAGHEVSLWDQCHPEYTDERFLDYLRTESPGIVGLSFLSNLCYPGARDLSRKVKAAVPEARVVYGGVFPTVNARKIVENEASVDVVARGEGEGIIVDLANDPDDLGQVAGIVFRTATGEVVETPERAPIADLDTLPFPDRESLDIHYVASMPLEVPAVVWDRPYATILSSRGCPFTCTFCNCPTISRRRCRMRSAENVLAELEEIERQGYGAFAFVDDNFLLKLERATSICEGIVSRDMTFDWACEGRADMKDLSIFKTLSRAGCDGIMFGVESGSQRVLDGMNKRTKLPDIHRAVEAARRAGIAMIHGFFIVGSPDETEEEIRQTFDFARRIPLNSFAFNTLVAFRGTQLWADAVGRGLIDEERDWDKIFPVHEIYPEAIDSETLFQMRASLVGRLIRKKIFRHPIAATRLFRRLLRTMSLGDLWRLLASASTNRVRRQPHAQPCPATDA